MRMNADKLIKLYEKSYYHEIEMREKINSRMQLPLAIIIAEITLLSYCLQKSTVTIDSSWLYIFTWASMVSSGIIIIFATYFFVRSIYNHVYQFMPQPYQTEKYRKTLIETYESYGNDNNGLADNYFNDYITKYYIECSSTNCIINDRRSALIHKTYTCLIFASISLLGSFLLVHIIDKNTRAALKHVISQCSPVNKPDDSGEPNRLSQEGAKNDTGTVPGATTSSPSATQEISAGGSRAFSTRDTSEAKGKMNDGRTGTNKESASPSATTENAFSQGGDRSSKTFNPDRRPEKGVNNR